MIQDGQQMHQGETVGGEVVSRAGSSLDMAVDALAALLRDFGENAFDLPEAEATTIAAWCNEWAKHVLFATPPPGQSAFVEAWTGGKRDWHGLRCFFHRQRQQESDYVAHSLGEMRQVIWTCVHELNRSMLGDSRTDERMQSQMERVKQAVQSTNLEEIKREALSAVAAMNRLMEDQRQQHMQRMEALHARIRELDCLLAEARKEGALDAVTGIFNRKAFNEHLTHTVDLVGVFGESACLFLVDADYFKTINDTYGHPAGDAVLRALADCLTGVFPGRSDFVARYGGEEFAVICHEMTQGEAERIADRLLRAVRDLTISYGEVQIDVTVSIGLAAAQGGEGAPEWLDRVDRALYRAKQQGRNRQDISL